MLSRAILILSIFFVMYWVLGTFRFLRANGMRNRIRWGLAAVFALWAGGLMTVFH